LQENYATLNNKSDRFEHELTLLKHLKGVSDLQSVAKLQNKTEHLEQELRNTNNKVSSLTNDGTSRKQDFIALLNKLQSIEQKTNTLDVRHNVTTAVLQGELHNINNRGEYIFSFNKVQRPSWS
jgi:predicted  nucleic acid-binding Zn-ribbon protein